MSPAPAYCVAPCAAREERDALLEALRELNSYLSLADPLTPEEADVLFIRDVRGCSEAMARAARVLAQATTSGRVSHG